MSVIEIVGGVILLIVSAAIVFLTLMQHTHGQGLSGAINGSAYGANNARLTPADQMLAKGDPHCRHRLLCGGDPGLCVCKPSGLSTRMQPRVGQGCFSARKSPKSFDDSLGEAAASGMCRRRQEEDAECARCVKRLAARWRQSRWK